jgi:hypothetical protein
MKTRIKKHKKFFLISTFLIISLMLTGVANAAIVSYTPDISTAFSEQKASAVATYVEGIENQNIALKESEVNDIITTITFSEYLSFAELDEYISNYEIEIVQLQLRALSEDGTRLSVFTRTDKGLAETEELLLAQAQNENAIILGITGMNALIDSDNLQGVDSDEKTYLADTSGDRFFEGVMIPNSIQRNDFSANNRGGMFPQSLAWDLEELCAIN